MMKVIPFAALAVASCILAGCGNEETANTSPPPGDTVAAPETPAAEPAQPLPTPPSYVAEEAVNAVQQNVGGEVDPFLTEQLRVFVRERRRLPTSFSELAQSRLDAVPRAPQGRKWVIDAAAMQVKSVPVN